MKGKERRFVRAALQHVYKITNDFGILFYRTSDRLVMFSIMSVMSRKHKVRVSGVSLMFTHIHEALYVNDYSQMAAYERDCMSTYSRISNKDQGLRGNLFKHFGWASKTDPKSRKSCLVYVLNNPPEKKLCRRAIEDRWNFLAYYNNPNPFSKPLVKHRASYYLREACGIIDHEFVSGRYLRPAVLRLIFSKIGTKEEREQLVDYIITKYNFIDYESGINLFGSYENMVAATDAMTGAEYDVGEEYGVKTDVPYVEMIRMAAKDGLLGSDIKLLHLMPQDRIAYIKRYLRIPGATDNHIKSFFHIK